MKAFLSRLGMWLLDRLEEKSTYTGLALLGVCLGHQLPENVLETVSWWGAFVATGLVSASTKGPK